MELPQSLLDSLGLSHSEAAVYLAALELGEASIQDLSRKSLVKRTSIYNFIDKLKQRQLITEKRSGRRSVYAAVHPEQLLENIKLRMLEYQRVLPELLAIHKRSRRKPSVTFYEGVEGIKDVYLDALREAEPIVAWTDWKPMLDMMGDFLCDYPVERARRGIEFKQITRDSPAAREVSKRDKDELRTTKFLDSEDLRTEIMIYGDKVAIMSFRTPAAFGLIIEDRGTAETLRVGWQELWERL